MERTVAIKKLGKLLGKSFGYRVNDKAPDAEERAAARELLKPVVALKVELEAKLNERKQAILNADTEYQSLRAVYKAASEQAADLYSRTHHYKFTVGRSNSLFFHVTAEGDSWEEVIQKVTAGQTRAA